MDYEKKYKEALEWARKVMQGKVGFVLDEVLEKFPELKKSKDERMIQYFKDLAPFDKADELYEKYGFSHKDAIAWLEKQSETFTKKDVDDAYLKGVCDAKQEFEKQGEQNTIVVIPKFRVGDVIRPKGSTAEYTIESISGECYHGKGWGMHISCDDDYELVEQRPADITDEWIEEYWQHEKVNNPYSYNKSDEIQFDYQGFVSFCKKYCQNPAWSEEDEKMIEIITSVLQVNFEPTERFSGYEEYMNVDLINWLKSLRPQKSIDWTMQDEEELQIALDTLVKAGQHSSAKWLKNVCLVPQKRWKPTEEQLEALNEVVNYAAQQPFMHWNDYLYNVLKTLREQLKN